jgi:hypothetical protein
MVLLQLLVLDLSIMFVHVKTDILVLVIVMVRFNLKEKFKSKYHLVLLVVLGAQMTTAASRCGSGGRPYPSRNPNNPIGCWCNNGTHIEEIRDDGPPTYCL